MLSTQKVEKYIHENQLLLPHTKIIVGVSGGGDSVALLDILHSLGYECIVAHCNFHLRGEESFRDEYFVERLAIKYKLEYVSTHFDTKKYVADGSISVEMAARELRYAWFEKIRKEYNAEYIAVGHHQDDSIETVLLNLIRGTGIRGLSGIAAKNGKIIRPLLCMFRSEVLEYLNNKGIDFVEDSTNGEDIYTRNKLRLNIIPLLESINPSVKQAISRTSNNLYQAEKIYLSYIERVKKKIFLNGKINTLELLKQKEPKTILFEILNGYGFNSATVDNIYDSIDAQSGKIFYSDFYRIIKDRDSLILEEIHLFREKKLYLITEEDEVLHEPIRLKLSTFNKDSKFTIEKNSTSLFLDKHEISFPLIIRKWEHGDWFIPFGMKGRKKLSDYFSNKKFSLLDKENVWLICSGEDIIWIVGERSDDRFKITNKTKEIFKIELDNG